MARAELVGTAHNLWRAGDIAGTYGAAGAGVAIAGGGQVARLETRAASYLNCAEPKLVFRYPSV